MSRRQLANFKKLASQKGNLDPLEYVWRRYEKARRQKGEKAEEKALTLAMYLVEFGHGKVARVDGNTGETAMPATVVFKLE